MKTTSSMKAKIFSLYNDGDHIGCFATRQSAEHMMEELRLRMADIEEEEYEPRCDCRNRYLSNYSDDHHNDEMNGN